jgi:hypothetical protein
VAVRRTTNPKMYNDNEQLPPLAIKTKTILLKFCIFDIGVNTFFMHGRGRELSGKALLCEKVVHKPQTIRMLFLGPHHGLNISKDTKP